MEITNFKQIVQEIPKNHKDNLLIFVVIIIGVILRVYLFPDIPPGLNQDEAAAGYEAYSLLLTGKDKWGNSLPVYLPAWGSGTTALYPYLSIPLIVLFGLNILTTRAVNLIFGILTLPLLYISVKEVCGQRVALISTFLLAVLPWHIMMSRWGLDCNLLPFFLLLGTYTVSRSLAYNLPTTLAMFAFVPWAIGLYAYATSFSIIPVLIALVILTNRKIIWQNKRKWFGAILIFIVLSLPISLFIVKNFIFHSNLGFEQILPFSVPLLPANKLAQIAMPFRQMVYTNLIFIFNGFQDGTIWNALTEFPPLFMIIFPFLGVGILLLTRRFFMLKETNIFLLWLVSCLPLIFVAQLNINRANAFFIPVIVVSTIGFVEILKAISLPDLQTITMWTAASWIIINSAFFSISYFKYYPGKINIAFNDGLGTALTKANELALPSEKILISQRIPLPYVYVLFYLKIPPPTFQLHSHYTFNSHGIYVVHTFARFYFDFDSLTLNSDESFIYALRTGDKEVCAEPNVMYKSKFWKVGRCIFKQK